MLPLAPPAAVMVQARPTAAGLTAVPKDTGTTGICAAPDRTTTVSAPEAGTAAAAGDQEVLAAGEEGQAACPGTAGGVEAAAETGGAARVPTTAVAALEEARRRGPTAATTAAGTARLAVVTAGTVAARLAVRLVGLLASLEALASEATALALGGRTSAVRPPSSPHVFARPLSTRCLLRGLLRLAISLFSRLTDRAHRCEVGSLLGERQACACAKQPRKGRKEGSAGRASSGARGRNSANGQPERASVSLACSGRAQSVSDERKTHSPVSVRAFDSNAQLDSARRDLLSQGAHHGSHWACRTVASSAKATASPAPRAPEAQADAPPSRSAQTHSAAMAPRRANVTSPRSFASASTARGPAALFSCATSR